jgi:DNA replication ATP-dependent helicase Dna2
MSKEVIKKGMEPIFDIVILEEASQAFLATIAACKILARKLIIVGDPMQLEPIVRQPNPQAIHPNIPCVIEGLKTYAYNCSCESVRLSETYRLTPKAASQTGLFYENTLVSKSSAVVPISLNTEYRNLFDNQGGTSIHFMEISDEGREPEAAILFIQKIVKSIHHAHPDIKIAILAPFRTTVRALQEKIFASFVKHEWLTIETIDRIQGLTCDLTIFLIPFGGTAFGLKTNRFNVATSRAKMGTLIITDKRYESFNFGTGPVAEFWAGLVGLNQQ